MEMRPVRLAAALCLLGALAACGITSPSDLTNETFMGTIASGGTPVVFPFSASRTGEFVAKITSLTPDSGSAVGVAYGQPSSGMCSLINQNNIVGPGGPPAFDFQLPAGAYCAEVYDSGFLPPGRTEAFTLVVSHR
jgi:hypothetical protein